MELQDRVTVVLTQYGANVLNKQNKEYNDKFHKAEILKTNYVAGDFLSDHLFCIIDTFKDHFHIVTKACFTNIIPEIKGIDVDMLRFWEHINSDNVKEEEDGRSELFAKKGEFRFNGFLFALDNFSCPIISTDHMIVKLDKREEFVSIESYDVLSRAYDSAMDEITKLRAKLAGIQELIKDK
ncbi:MULTISPECIES: hypothetical protein [Butyricimonas]|uniref:hypothetical protein n=1 Tax=Butyricimonas TaxID=574697 RepID=UPI0007FB4DC2|nr:MULTISPECIES: hypothetical protein [Butyricimonas]